MIYFDTVVNLMLGIWKGLFSSPIRALFIRSNEIHTRPQKGIIFGKKLNFKILEISNALFRELQQYYEIKYLQTEEIYLNQSLRENSRIFT